MVRLTFSPHRADSMWMTHLSRRQHFGKASGSMNVLGVLFSLMVVGLIVLMFFAWMLRDLG